MYVRCMSGVCQVYVKCKPGVHLVYVRCMTVECQLYVRCMSGPEIHPTVSGVKCYKALKIENSPEKKN